MRGSAADDDLLDPFPQVDVELDEDGEPVAGCAAALTVLMLC